MNAIAKTSTFALVLVATAPLIIVTVSGCDKFKKGGDGDAASDAAPAATAETTPTESATPSATTITTPTWRPTVRVDGGAKLGDGGVVKLADGGMAAPIPTPVPGGTLVPPPGFPTAFPSTVPALPPGFPSSLPKGIPSVLPSQPKP